MIRWMPRGAARDGAGWVFPAIYSLVTALLVLLGFSGLSLWTRQQAETTASVTAQANALATRAAQADLRAATAEARAVAAEGALTAIPLATATQLAALANASATARAIGTEPVAFLERSLQMVFNAYQDPVEPKIKALADVFQPNAAGVFRAEMDHLVISRLKLGGESKYTVEVLGTERPNPNQTEIRTREQWTFDEVNAQGLRTRCVVEISDQTYLLTRAAESGPWVVENIQLADAKRTPC